MKLTKEEEDWVLQRRAEQEANMPYRSAVLKHDLWYMNHTYITLNLKETNSYFLTDEMVDQLRADLENIINGFMLLKKGTPFESFLDGRDELWFDCVGFGAEEMDPKWANDNLTDFKNLR